MTPDHTTIEAFARLADALSDDIITMADAELGEAFPGRSGGVAADAWRQMVRRIVAPDDAGMARSAFPLNDPERRHEEDKP